MKLYFLFTQSPTAQMNSDNAMTVSIFKRNLLDMEQFTRTVMLARYKEWMMKQIQIDPLARSAYLWVQEAEAVSSYASQYEFAQHHIWITVNNHLKSPTFMKFIDSVVKGCPLDVTSPSIITPIVQTSTQPITQTAASVPPVTQVQQTLVRPSFRGRQSLSQNVNSANRNPWHGAMQL